MLALIFLHPIKISITFLLHKNFVLSSETCKIPSLPKRMNRDSTKSKMGVVKRGPSTCRAKRYVGTVQRRLLALNNFVE